MQRVALFEEHRQLLFSIAYHMLGTVMDAEDMVQEAYLRWQVLHDDEIAAIQAPKAYLSTIITRLCLNQVGSAKAKREDYIGEWLPEPLIVDPALNPEQATALGETLSIAFLVVLEQLDPTERAVFLLRKVFDYDYADIAAIVGKSEANCRQILSRAQKRVLAERPLLEIAPPPQEKQQQMVLQFLTACQTGDMQQLMALLSPTVVDYSDGGGKISAALKPIYGAEKVARYFLGLAKKAPPGFGVRLVQVNGQQLGILMETSGQPWGVLVLDIVNDLIQTTYVVVNPEKLTRIGQQP